MSKIKVCMISGSFEYDSLISLDLFDKFLAEKFPEIETEIIAYENENHDLSLEPIEIADVVILFTRRIQIDGENLDRFKNYCDSGGAIIGIRTASHAYQNWLDLDRDVLGGSYDGHFGHGPIAKVEIVAHHPVLSGVTDFDSFGSLYKNRNNADDTETLMIAHTDEGNREPVTWLREHNGGRIFYTSLGHQKDFEIDKFLKLLANAIFWTAKLI